MTSCIGVLMLHITFSKYDCIIVHKAFYLFTCTCVSINSFHSHSHSHIHAPLVKRVYSECSPLFQLIKLINILKHDKSDTILRKITEKSHSYNGFVFNVTRCFLNT